MTVESNTANTTIRARRGEAMDSQTDQGLTERLCTAEELADILRLHPVTVARRMRTGEIKGAFKVGRGWRIKKSDRDAYLVRLGFITAAPAAASA
jgi:excisionase family DNA binding protein